MTPPSLLKQLDNARTRLARAGVPADEAVHDAEVLARHALGWDRATFLTRRAAPAPEGFVAQYRRLVTRRERREPVSLITGCREFWGLNFAVTPDVLTPRPETELLVEESLALLGETPRRTHRERRRVADVGTGSGCIAIALACTLGDAAECDITALDLSPAALSIAKQNADRHGMEHRIDWVEGHLLAGRPAKPLFPFDLVVANLPYVATDDMQRLPPEVARFEPHLALAGGSDGLDVIRALLDQVDAPDARLVEEGHVILEIGIGQLDGIADHVASLSHLAVRSVRTDLQEIPRIVVIQKGRRDV